MSLFEELKRRNVFRVAIAYLLLGWAVLQGADFLLDLVGAPEWVIRALAVIGLVGFPFALFFAWAFELTPEGIKRDHEVDRSQAIATNTGKKLNGVIIGLLLLVILLMAAERIFFTGGAAPQENAAVAEAPDIAVAQPLQNSVAVLPFVNMSADPDNEYFSEGVAEEILNVLARVPELKVTARTSSFSYKGSEATIAEIARELGVNHVLEGSVRKAGNRVRVTAQLIEAGSDFHLWSETYDRELDDIFAIQDEIAQAIAAALKVQLLPAAEQPNYTGTTNLEAYQMFLQGVNQWHLRSGESLDQALDLFQQAIDLDPEFARAHAYLGLTWAVIWSYEDLSSAQTRAHVRTQARQAAQAALSLDPTSIEAATVLINPGEAESPRDRQALVTRGEALIARNPGFATTYQWHATNLLNVGRAAEAIDAYRFALELDPRSRVTHENLAELYLALGRFDEAEQLLQHLDSFAPDYWDGVVTWFELYLLTGQREEAARTGERLARLLGRTRDSTPVYLDLFFAPERKAAALAEITSFPLENWWSPDNPALIDDWGLAYILAAAGAYEEALVFMRVLADRGKAYAADLAWVSTITGEFNCLPEVQAFFEEYGWPELPDPPDCAP